MSTVTQNEHECVKSLTDSLGSTVTFISPCPSSRSISAQKQLLQKTNSLVRVFLWEVRHHKEEPTPEWALDAKWRGFFVIINYSATKLSAGSLEILGWMASLLQSSRVLLPHCTPADKEWNYRPLQTSTPILVSRIYQFMGSNRFKELSHGWGRNSLKPVEGLYTNSLNMVTSVEQVSAPCILPQTDLREVKFFCKKKAILEVFNSSD